MSAGAETVGAERRPRRRSKVVGTVAGVKVKGSAVPQDRQAAVLLASEGREFTAASIALAADLARAERGNVLVLSIARVHGVGFGLQAPGLVPTKAEWDEQREIVGKAVARLRRRGIRAEGQVLGTRKAAKRICAMAGELGSGGLEGDVIVLGGVLGVEGAGELADPVAGEVGGRAEAGDGQDCREDEDVDVPVVSHVDCSMVTGCIAAEGRFGRNGLPCRKTPGEGTFEGVFLKNVERTMKADLRG